MKPLYLQGTELRIERDGPALKVSHPNRADAWYPLRRVSQIISAPRVDWTTEALLACAEVGITICFLDDQGTVLARVLGRPGERGELRQRLADFLTRPDWPTLYEQWLTAMERMALRSVIRRAGLDPADGTDAKSLRQGFREAARSMGLLAAFERIGGDIHGLLVALVTQHLAEAGLDGESEAAEGPLLAGNLADVLFWDFQLARMAWLEERLLSEALGVPDRADTVAHFEARRARTERLAAGLIYRLHQWLAGLH